MIVLTQGRAGPLLIYPVPSNKRRNIDFRDTN